MNEMKMNSRIYILIVIGTVSAIGPFVTDFYLPALPELMTFFGTTSSMTQLSLTFSMIGLAIGQIFIGPLSDKYGRKVPLILSMLLFTLSTIFCIFSWNIECFIISRFVQGFTGAGGIVISRSIATDLYSDRELAKFFSMLSCVQGLAPICAPVLGGMLLKVTDWRGIFFTLLIIGALTTLVLTRFRDSLSKENRLNENIITKFLYYKPLLKNEVFMYYVLIQSFSMGVMFAYIASSPFIYQKIYHLSPIAYSLCFGVNAFAIMIGNLSITRFSTTEEGLLTGVKGFITMSIITVMSLCISNSIFVIEITFFCLLFFLGMILPTSTTLALDMEKQNSGNASAIIGFLTFVSGGVISPLTGLGNIIYSTSIIIVLCCVLILFCTKKVIKPIVAVDK
jgi:DHA1 family bicyclomycin/chloramphenicol resistance-like MFS transporter